MNNLNMDSDLRAHIGSIYGVEAWERLTVILWNNGTGYDLWKFEQDVEYSRKNYRCIIIQRNWYDAEISMTDIDTSEDIFSDAWEI